MDLFSKQESISNDKALESYVWHFGKVPASSVWFDLGVDNVVVSQNHSGIYVAILSKGHRYSTVIDSMKDVEDSFKVLCGKLLIKQKELSSPLNQ